MARALRLLKRLLGDSSALATTEFALVLPLLLTAGLTGLEVANLALRQMQVSQLAVHIADNASRIGDTSTLEDRKIYESDINDLLIGANLQAGTAFGLFERGRVIISSLEVYPGTASRQYIHWQRCLGKKTHTSSYGAEGDGITGTLTGMGPTDNQVTAFKDEAVMFVEIAYDYKPIVGNVFGFSRTLKAIASFTVRDDRDLAQIYQRVAAKPDPIAACNRYDVSILTAT